MFQIKKMYKGRNPSPPGGHVDFDYRSSFNAHQLVKAIDRLKAVKKKVPFADLNFIREALDKSLKVTNALRGKNQEPDPCPEVVPESICHDLQSTLASCSFEENSKHKEVLNEFKSLQMSDNFKKLPYLKLNSEKMYDENREDDLEATFLRNKVHEIKENIFDGSSLDHSSTRCLEYSSDGQASRTKMQERRNSTEYRKHHKKSHREKKKELGKKRTYEDDLKEFSRSRRSGRYRSYQTKSRYSGRSSDDNSNSSYEHRSYIRDRRSISKDRVSRKKIRDVNSSDNSPEYSPKNRFYRRSERRRSKESISRSRSKERSKSRDRVSRKKFRESSYSSDNCSEYSPKKRSYRRSERRRSKESVSRSRSKERSKSRDRVSRKNLRESSYSSDNCSEYSYKRKERHNFKESTLQIIDVKAKPELPSDTYSDSNTSVKATPKSQQEDISKLSAEDFGNESQSARSSEVMREERLDSPPSQPMPNQFKLSPRSEQNENSLPYDEEYAAGAFVGAEAYYCKVCQKNLNGITCYETHMKGKKHKKAENALRRTETVSCDQKAGNNIKKEPLVNPELLASIKDGNMIESFETAKYQEKIDGHRDDPIQGLEYVDEIHNNYDGTITYYCNLCSAPCVQTSIFSHLIGIRHCLRYLQKIYPIDYDRLQHKPKHVAQTKIKGIFQAYEKRHGRKKIRVMICLKKPKPSPLDAADGYYSMEEENKLNAADYLDESGNYYCSICDATMNNENMLYSHMVGKRHLKNVKKTSSGHVPSMPISSSKKEKVPNARSKLEMRLQHYHESPIVGLNFIRETQNMNGENYTCFICNSCTSKDILDHITSMKHQMKYLETVDANNTIPNGFKHIRELEVNDQTRKDLVEEECRVIEGKHGRGRVEVYR